jgi:hypothetical protein
MQCPETKGSRINTYELKCNAMSWDQGFNVKHLSHHFLFHSPFGINGYKFTYKLHLITSYFINITCISSLLFTPLLSSMDKKLLIIILLNDIGNLWVLLRWNQFPPLLTDPRECYPCPTYFLNNPWSFDDD